MERYYDKVDGRLVYLGESAIPDFWDTHWDTGNFKETMERVEVYAISH